MIGRLVCSGQTGAVLVHLIYVSCLLQDDKADVPDQDNKGIEMEGDFEGSLQDMQPDPDADDQEQDGDEEERLDQVCQHPPHKNGLPSAMPNVAIPTV